MAYLESIYVQLHPSNYSSWVKQQDEYWDATRSVETKQIFNILKDGQWHCRNCDISNPNFARRIQDLKEMGYTISTHVITAVRFVEIIEAQDCCCYRSTELKLQGTDMKHGLQHCADELYRFWEALMFMRTHSIATAYQIISFRKYDGICIQRPKIQTA